MSLPGRRSSGPLSRTQPARKASKQVSFIQRVEQQLAPRRRHDESTPQPQPEVLQHLSESPLFPELARRQIFGDDDDARINRVGEEVEKFAEYVDRWQKTKEDLAGKSETEQYKAAKDLATTFGKIAAQKYKELKKNQRQSRRDPLSKSWRGRIESLADSASPEPRSANELILRMSEDGDEDLTVMRQWKAEADSWKLLVAVTDLHASKPSPANKEDFQRHHPIDKYSPNTDLWTTFIFEDDAARERKVILEWLEKTADDSETSFDKIVEQLESRTGTGHGTWQHGWLNTRERIKAEKRLRSITGSIPANEAQVRSSDGSKALATQLDPDASARQKASLEKQDEHYERSLWLACYELLRRGKSWKDIQEWFEERNEGWRAASLGAAQDLTRQNSRLCLAGPYAGALWRRMCLASSKQTSADKYERAVYGLLAGDTESVEPVCQTWEDLVYMNYNSLLLASFEAWLQQNHPERFPSVLPQKFPLYQPVRPAEELPDYKNQILKDMLQRPNSGLSPDQPIRWIQAMLITDSVEDLILDLSITLATRANENTSSRLMHPPLKGQEAQHDYTVFPDNYDAVRIIVHMIIIFSEAGLKFSQDLDIHIQNIFVSYIEMLRLLGKIEAIPTYARFINDSARYEVMGSIVSQIKDHDEQERLVRLMAAAQLNVTAILSDQYILAGEGLNIEPGGSAESIDRFHLVDEAAPRWAGWRVRGDLDWPVGVELTDILTPEENEVVWAVQWFFRCNSTYQDTFFGLSYILKELLRTGHTTAALAVTHKVPFKLMAQLKSVPVVGEALDPFDEIEFSDTEEGLQLEFQVRFLRDTSRQALELQQLCLAIEALINWRKMEESLTGLPDDKLMSKEIRDRLEDFLLEVEIALQPLLNGFMTRVEDEVDEAEYKLLRQVYLPDIILAYNGAITFSADFLGPETLFKSLNLATIIADESNAALAAAFVDSGRMGDLLTAFAVSSRQLLAINQGIEASEQRAKKSAQAGGAEGKKILGRIKRKKSRGMGRKWGGETLGIWDPQKLFSGEGGD